MQRYDIAILHLDAAGNLLPGFAPSPGKPFQ